MIAHALREQVCDANLELVRRGLVMFTWGNASAIDRESGLIAIKPSGVDYDRLTPADIVLVDLKSGKPVSGTLQPSSDTATHRVLYREFPSVGGIVHTHSHHATVWAQAGFDLPCYGTTHADHFYGSVPCTTPMTVDEIFGQPGYEENTGECIAREFSSRALDPARVPAALVHGHGPFAWGESAARAVEAAAILEAVARMAWDALTLNPRIQPISHALLDRHYFRKHGPGAYYGQQPSAPDRTEHALPQSGRPTPVRLEHGMAEAIR